MMNSTPGDFSELRSGGIIESPVQRRLVLATMALALMMVMSAVSGLNVALPDLARSTAASQTDLQWIVDAYTLVFAGLLLPAGALGDRFGRRLILLVGLVIFGSAAGLATQASDAGQLIWLRAAMGVGAALVMPTTLSVITTSFPPEERGRAVGFWVGVAGGGAVLGLLGSGLLLEWFPWSSFFALNVTLAVIAAAGTLAFVPASRAPSPPRLDPVGALLSLAGLVAVVYGVIEAPGRGWLDPATLALILGGMLLLTAFVLWELRAAEPMLDPRLFRARAFGAGSLSITVQFFAAFGFFFIIIQYLQFVAGFSPLKASAVLLPMPLVMIPLARRAPAIADRRGAGRVGAAGLVLIAAGLLTLSRLGVDFSYAHFWAGLVVFAAGMALAGTPATAAIVGSLPPAKQGVASAVNDTSRELGAALGIAVLGSVLGDRYRAGIESATAHLPPAIAAQAEHSIAAVKSGSAAGSGRLVAAAEQAFVEGTAAALTTAAIVLLAGASFVFLRNRRAAPAARAHDTVGESAANEAAL
jgi:EmrB/QacA subfamily drug resistance transporter